MIYIGVVVQSDSILFPDKIALWVDGTGQLIDITDIASPDMLGKHYKVVIELDEI